MLVWNIGRPEGHRCRWRAGQATNAVQRSVWLVWIIIRIKQVLVQPSRRTFHNCASFVRVVVATPCTDIACLVGTVDVGDWERLRTQRKPSSQVTSRKAPVAPRADRG